MIMFGIINYEFYLLATMLFIMTPGMDTLFVLNSSIGESRKAGIYAALGVNAGILVHTFFAAFGLTVLLAKSAMAFMIIKYLGAAYLIFIGIKALVQKHQKIEIQGYEMNELQSFNRGLITNVLNPKVALFFLSFFPQFVNHNTIGSALPFLILGFTYVTLGIMWYISLVLFVSMFSQKLKNQPTFQKYMNRISGFVFVLMGVKVALTKN